jgi:hypothetical protein
MKPNKVIRFEYLIIKFLLLRFGAKNKVKSKSKSENTKVWEQKIRLNPNPNRKY